MGELLTQTPEVRRVYVLIRATDETHASDRMEYDIFSSPLFQKAKTQNTNFVAFCRDKVRFVIGNTSRPHLGMAAFDYLKLLGEVDLVVNSAASTDFMGPMDEIIETNTISVRHIAGFVKKSAKARLLHVSTCFVNENQRGTVFENHYDRPSLFKGSQKLDIDGLLEQQGLRIDRLRERHSEPRRRHRSLIRAGHAWATSHGWNNIYTLTKWLGENYLRQEAQNIYCTIIRPSIIESCLSRPEPGWVEGFKVADPLIYGGGKGLIPYFPGSPNTVADLIPADLVSNAMMIAGAELLQAQKMELKVYQSCTGSDATLYTRDIATSARAAFGVRNDKRFFVPPVVFMAIMRLVLYSSYLIPGIKKQRKFIKKLHDMAQLFSPYASMKVVFDNQQLNALHAQLSTEDAKNFPVSMRGQDWDYYIRKIHIPGLVKFVIREDKKPRSAHPLFPFFSFLAKNYFRSEIVENHKVDKERPTIFMSNHSGMSFPWDLFALEPVMQDWMGSRPVPTTLVAPILFRFSIGHLFGVKDFWRFPQHIPATMENYEHLARSGKNILIYPEGIPGISKGFHRKYQLQTFSSSSIRMALKYGHQLVPLYTLNAEYNNPFGYCWQPLNRFAERFGLPFYSLGWANLLISIFPSVLYIALPTKQRFFTGQAMDVASWTQKPYNLMSDTEIREITARVQHLMQGELRQLEAQYGHTPFAWGELIARIPRLGLGSVLLFPLIWPFWTQALMWKENPSFKNLLRSLYVSVALSTPILGWPLYGLYLALSPKPRETELPQELRSPEETSSRAV